MFKTFKASERELFNRDGSPNTRPFAVGAKGRPWTSYIDRCGRCGGAGRAERWAHTGYTCFDCGGSGKGPTRAIPLYTCEELAKLNATQAKRNATKQAKRDAAAAKAQAEADARRADFMAANKDLIARMETHASANEFIADVLARVLDTAKFSSDKQVDAVVASMDRADERKAKIAKSDHVGTVGERLTLKVKVERVTSFQRPAFNAPWTTDTVWVVTMRDEAGNCFVSMGSFHTEENAELTIRGTVKEHSVYKDQKQTKLSRVAEHVAKAKKAKVKA